VTSQCDFGQLSVIHSRLDVRKEEERTGFKQRPKNIPLRNLSAGDNKAEDNRTI